MVSSEIDLSSDCIMLRRVIRRLEGETRIESVVFKRLFHDIQHFSILDLEIGGKLEVNKSIRDELHK